MAHNRASPPDMANHMCFQVDKSVYSRSCDGLGIHVSPPDGDVGDFMRLCEHLLDFDWDLFKQ